MDENEMEQFIAPFNDSMPRVQYLTAYSIADGLGHRWTWHGVMDGDTIRTRDIARAVFHCADGIEPFNGWGEIAPALELGVVHHASPSRLEYWVTDTGSILFNVKCSTGATISTMLTGIGSPLVLTASGPVYYRHIAIHREYARKCLSVDALPFNYRRVAVLPETRYTSWELLHPFLPEMAGQFPMSTALQCERYPIEMTIHPDGGWSHKK
jgi:hypothetical protein